MSDGTTSVIFTPDFSAYAAEHGERMRLAEQLRPANKAVLFDALARLGIAQVVMSFDGEGDDGQIGSAVATRDDQTSVELPEDVVPIQRPKPVGIDGDTLELTLSGALEQLAYDFLDQAHGGWENDDGAYGEFTFDVAARTITLDFNERFVTADYSQHLF